MKVLIDTSFLLFCTERGKDYLKLLERTLAEVVEPLVLQSVLDELERLASGEGRKGAAARAALTMAKTMGIVKARHRGGVDDQIMAYASIHGIPVVTVDSSLVKRLTTKSIPYITFTRTGRPVVRLILR